MARRKGLARRRRSAVGDDGKIQLGELWFLAPIGSNGWDATILEAIDARLGPEGLGAFGGDSRVAALAAWAASESGREKTRLGGIHVYEVEAAEIPALVRQGLEALKQHNPDNADDDLRAAAARINQPTDY